MLRTAVYRLATILLVTASALAAAEETNPPAAQDPAAPATGQPPAPQTPPTAAPGEEVVHPTEHGMRLTPALARVMTQAMTRQMGRDFKISEDQQKQLSEAYARRLMEIGRKYEEPGQAFAECAIESIWGAFANGKAGDGMRFTPEMAREFGSKALTNVPAWREMLDAALEEAKPIVSPEVYNQIAQKMEKPRKEMERFEQRMQRWSRGEAKEGEDPFNEPQPVAAPADGKTQVKPRTPEVQRAERMADSTVGNTGPGEWAAFLVQVKTTFNFDQQQSAAADQILEQYRVKAEAIMTPQWKEAMRQNRIKANLRQRLSGVPTIPFMWRIDHEYAQAQRPIQELGWAFKKEILALLTGAQKDLALSDISARAAQQGLKLDDKDKAVLGIQNSPWSLWKF